MLIASLALNFIIVGLVVGVGIERWKHGPRMMDVREVNFGPFNGALSPEDRDVLRKAFTQRVGAGMRLRLENRQDFNAFVAALRKEPFDAEAVKTVFGTMRDRNIERLAVGEDLLLERIDRMPEDMCQPCGHFSSGFLAAGFFGALPLLAAVAAAGLLRLKLALMFPKMSGGWPCIFMIVYCWMKVMVLFVIQ